MSKPIVMVPASAMQSWRNGNYLADIYYNLPLQAVKVCEPIFIYAILCLIYFMRDICHLFLIQSFHRKYTSSIVEGHVTFWGGLWDDATVCKGQFHEMFLELLHNLCSKTERYGSNTMYPMILNRLDIIFLFGLFHTGKERKIIVHIWLYITSL